jgi:hypothetical protein
VAGLQEKIPESKRESERISQVTTSKKMKTTPQYRDQNPRHDSNPRAARSQSFPQIDHNYQSTQLSGNCGSPVKFHRPAFFEISNKYFADEAARSFVVDAGVFAALIGTALLPIANSLQAVAALIHTLGVL